MTFVRLDPTKPADLKSLIANGLIWQPTVPAQYKEMAVTALAEGDVEMPANLPPAVVDEVNKRRNDMGLPPMEMPGEPEGDGTDD